MDNLIGYPLIDALKKIDNNKIVNIVKLIGTNKNFNDLKRPYVIRKYDNDKYITLYVSYY
ncbi:MAG: hypothetical protein ACERLG_05120 [Sedimentibacter sp.]